MYNIDGGIELIQKIRVEHHPKIIILGIDLWWLNGNFDNIVPESSALSKDNFIQNRMFLYGSLLDKVTSEEFRALNISLSESYYGLLDPVGHRKTIGLLAAKKGNGFRKDGSYQYGNIIMGDKGTDENFKNTHERIEKGYGRFEYTDQVDQSRLTKLEKLIDILREDGSEIVVFLPPFAHEIYMKMRQSPHHKFFLSDFQQKMKELCNEKKISFYDFSDINSCGSNDEEAIDGFHGSERTYAKMMLMMRADPILNEVIDTDTIKKYLKESDHRLQIIPYEQ